ncbi:Nuclear control of ATPase protein 2 [Apiotrichum porosum]|uniref:Nuclear control of ATPase protein 2 n=1 Tax=Apiotrichum porosum TaxID=105984 RepID=A0A427XLI3_9TREE|nr:Nuclear control of ATPase protein 2 [Apiotrichum porosum]RSH79789.1 Nuclear control of ATPase protein 2 [Apiotrichum porosum]
MSFFSSPPPSYAQEQLQAHLGQLTTLPVVVPVAALETTTDVVPSRASDRLQHALAQLTAGKPPSLDKLADILDSVQRADDEVEVSEITVLDREAQAEVVTRAVSLIWAHTMQTFVDGALQLEDDRAWWDYAISSRTGTVVYLVQTLPYRVFLAAADKIQPGTFTEKLHSLHWPSRGSLFKSLHGANASISQQVMKFASPLQLTRREMLTNIGTLTKARDAAAVRVGILASQGPRWGSLEMSAAVSPTDLSDEAKRVYSVLCDVLDAQDQGLLTTKPGKVQSVGARRRVKGEVTPAALLQLIDGSLPRAEGIVKSTLNEFGRPSKFTRLWFPLLFLPPAIYIAANSVVKNKEWLKEQVSNARETVKGFFVQWVWEPLEEIANTMRGGGKGLDVSPETVKTDQESLERMVMDLGRDYYHLSGSQLEQLKKQVASGDMSSVLKVYENEMQSPIKNALTGNLIRTLLIQVQKTKTDLSLSLESLDQLLRSQQLTFAFVGVAPSVLLLWGAWGWVSSLWTGENRGKSRRRRYFHGMRNVERLLLTAPEDEARMSDKDRGLIIVSVSGLRTWATGISSARREAFLDDLRMVEDPGLARDDKLRVVERMWRCWGMDGRKVVV